MSGAAGGGRYTEELNKRTHVRWIREKATDAQIEDLRQHRNEMSSEIGELHRELERLRAENEALKIPKGGYEEMAAKMARSIEECAQENRRLSLEVGAWEEAVKRVRSAYPEDVFPPGPPYNTPDAVGADWARRVVSNVEQAREEIYEASVGRWPAPTGKEEQDG